MNRTKASLYCPFAFMCALLACALLLSSCASVPAAPLPSAAPAAPVAAPAPSPKTYGDGEVLAAGYSAFKDAFLLDFEAYGSAEDIETIAELLAVKDMFVSMSADLDSAVLCAADAAYAAMKLLRPDIKPLAVSADSAGWKLMVALCCGFEENASQRLMRMCTYEISVSGPVTFIAFRVPSFGELMEGEPADGVYGAMGVYAYLNTIVDDEGNNKEYEEYILPEGYIDTLVEPLPKRNIKDGWAQPRSGNTRVHTGTDIRAPEGRQIHSCTSGTVVNIGYNDISGNRVVVRDEFGFIYSYCHMVELTDFLIEGDRVEAGDIIGHVGDTGNSDAPHLHLSIITPEYRYINPYPVLAEVRSRNG